MSATSIATIAALNDQFRQGFINGTSIRGDLVHTRGIEALGLEAVLDIWSKVRAFKSFTPDNDPYGEHDFGSIEHPLAGKVFWKIDYYAPDLQSGSEDPADPQKTHRVLTVMLASEY